jgi:proton-translocating NADH-quinone oxidoreductase chain M
MQIPYILLQVIIVPLITAVICVALGKRLGKNLGWIAGAALAYTNLLLGYVGYQLWVNGSFAPEHYSWSNAAFSINFGLSTDGLSLPVALIMDLVSVVCAIYSVGYMQHHIEQIYGKENKSMFTVYYSTFLLLVVGLVGVALSTNLIALFLFVELALIPSYVLIDLFGYRDRHRIATLYFIWNQIAASIFLAGIILSYVQTSSFEISALSGISGSSIGFWVCLLILVGWLIKMATFGFHVWLPYAHGESPTSITAIIATIVGLGSYVMARLLYGQLLASFQIFSLPLLIIGLITMIYAAYLTLAQDDVKHLYACSTIGQTAYSILGIASMTALGVAGGVFYFVSHIIGKCILLYVAGILITQTGVRSISEMGGLAKRMPWTATICIIGSLILSAVPPLAGFQAEWVMFSGIFQASINGNSIYLAIAIIAIFATFFTSVYTFWPVARMFFGPLPEKMQNVKEAPKSMLIPLFALGVTSLIIGMYPDLVMKLITSVI